MTTCILWFRNNLRLSDNLPVAHAYAHYERVIPLYIDQWSGRAEDEYGNEALGAHRKAFWQESLQDLQKRLRANGSDLFIYKGTPLELLPYLAKALGAQAIIAPREMAWNEQVEERELANWSKTEDVDVQFFEERTLYNEHELPFALNSLPNVFSAFRNKVEKRASPAAPIEEPDISPLPKDVLPPTPVQLPEVVRDPRSAFPLNGGGSAAWDCLDYYLWEAELVTQYKDTRNGLVGRDYSSKFSPYLALGCISARQVAHELGRFEDEVEKNEHTYWLFFELLWREFFQWVARAHGRRLFLANGLKPEVSQARRFNKKAFDRWKNGTTGDRFVDANMRELRATGFMSNRGRQNVASYLIHDMGLDWRCGAQWLESQLIDFDPASNYGNWLYIAGLGNDPRPFRKFNTRGQAERYDPDGAYQRLWLEHA